MRTIRETTNKETTTIAYHALLSSHVRFCIVARGAASATELQNKFNTSEKNHEIHRKSAIHCKPFVIQNAILTLTSLYILKMTTLAKQNPLEY